MANLMAEGRTSNPDFGRAILDANPDKEHPGCGARSNPMVVATLPTCLGPRTPFQAVRELAYEAANTPSKSQQNRGCREQKSTPIRLNASGALG
jgi:hypothetical protein